MVKGVEDKISQFKTNAEWVRWHRGVIGMVWIPLVEGDFFSRCKEGHKRHTSTDESLKVGVRVMGLGSGGISIVKSKMTLS